MDLWMKSKTLCFDMTTLYSNQIANHAERPLYLDSFPQDKPWISTRIILILLDSSRSPL